MTKKAANSNVINILYHLGMTCDPYYYADDVVAMGNGAMKGVIRSVSSKAVVATITTGILNGNTCIDLDGDDDAALESFIYYAEHNLSNQLSDSFCMGLVYTEYVMSQLERDITSSFLFISDKNKVTEYSGYAVGGISNDSTVDERIRNASLPKDFREKHGVLAAINGSLDDMQKMRMEKPLYSMGLIDGVSSPLSMH